MIPKESAKYEIKLSFKVDGLVEENQIHGALFGQTRGMGPAIDLQEISQQNKLAWMETEIEQSNDKTSGTVSIPLAMEFEECARVAAAIEEINQVAAFTGEFKVESIDGIAEEKMESIKSRTDELIKKFGPKKK